MAWWLCLGGGFDFLFHWTSNHAACIVFFLVGGLRGQLDLLSLVPRDKFFVLLTFCRLVCRREGGNVGHKICHTQVECKIYHSWGIHKKTKQSLYFRPVIVLHYFQRSGEHCLEEASKSWAIDSAMVSSFSSLFLSHHAACATPLFRLEPTSQLLTISPPNTHASCTCCAY